MWKCERLGKLGGEVPLNFKSERLVHPNLCDVDIQNDVQNISVHKKNVVSDDSGAGAHWTLVAHVLIAMANTGTLPNSLVYFDLFQRPVRELPLKWMLLLIRQASMVTIFPWKINRLIEKSTTVSYMSNKIDSQHFFHQYLCFTSNSWDLPGEVEEDISIRFQLIYSLRYPNSSVLGTFAIHRSFCKMCLFLCVCIVTTKPMFHSIYPIFLHWMKFWIRCIICCSLRSISNSVIFPCESIPGVEFCIKCQCFQWLALTWGLLSFFVIS